MDFQWVFKGFQGVSSLEAVDPRLDPGKEPGFTALFYLFCLELALRRRLRHALLLLALFLLLAALRTWRLVERLGHVR